MQNFICIMAPHVDADAPILQDLYRAFVEDPAAATLEARLRFRELTPDMVAAARGWLLEFQAYQATLQQQQTMQNDYREEQERKRRSEEESRRRGAELGGVYGSALASMGFSSTLSGPSSSYGGGLPSGGVSSAELDEQALARGMFAAMLVSVIDGNGAPILNADSRIQDSALNYLRGRLSSGEWVERIGGPDLRALFEQGQQLLAGLQTRGFIRWTVQEPFRIHAASVVPRSHLNELLSHLRGRATPVSAPDTEQVPGQQASAGLRPERGGFPSLRDLKTITRWLDQHRRALQEGQLTPLEVLNQGFLTGGRLTEEQFEDAVAGRIHLPQEVGLGLGDAIIILLRLNSWRQQGEQQAVKIALEALTVLDQDGLSWSFLGDFYSELEDWRSALASYERAWAINPKRVGSGRAKALFYLGPVCASMWCSRIPAPTRSLSSGGSAN